MKIFASMKGIGALAVVLIVSGLGTTAAVRAADVEGSSDHSLVGRYAGSEIVGYTVTEFDEANVVEAPFSPTSTNGGTGFKTLEGRVTLVYYTLPQGRSTLEVLRNYEEGLKSKGFSTVFTCATKNGSCFESGQPEGGYLLGQAVGDPLTIPKLADDYVHNWFQEGGRYFLARLDRPEGAVYAALYLGESSSGNVAVVRVVETKAMETGKIDFPDASQMQQTLADAGKIALYGILFDLDKDALKPESKPTLDEIAKLLTSKPDLKLKIVGHTDNQGGADYNLDLSRRRAASVVAALVSQYGIAADRLTADGAGMTQPVASNDTEDGRAKNRRVELQVNDQSDASGGSGSNPAGSGNAG
ncbi:OmpA family protein [Mesorhizobium sp. VK22B]|uniref:OmpA family protein n=1 Tax=Mesorhizobium captivum TaxID=3072319 RepID=A0ABU4Z194_9HYPH|nr:MULTISPECIES: OmpA family protein [unclassified Mesorhizobium]MDX8493016.1 OmpA family protein [Mesorhizobium sp. VK22B]MDX8509769.1 OmpA family protein [Mesorhizobium sp. VK22E]